MNLPDNQPQVVVSRQVMRHKLTELAFQDISTKYKVPRKARRAMSRAIGKKAFQAWRGEEKAPVNE